MAPLWYLVEKQGVGLGANSKNDQECVTFVQCVTKDQQMPLVAKAKYFSIQIDGSTDFTNVEGEVYLILYFNPHSDDRKVHVHIKFLAIR